MGKVWLELGLVDDYILPCDHMSRAQIIFLHRMFATLALLDRIILRDRLRILPLHIDLLIGYEGHLPVDFGPISTRILLPVLVVWRGEGRGVRLLLLLLVLGQDALAHAREAVLPGAGSGRRPGSRLHRGSGHGLRQHGILCLGGHGLISRHRRGQFAVELTRACVDVVRGIHLLMILLFKYIDNLRMMLYVYRLVLILDRGCVQLSFTSHHVLPKLLESPSVA